jgi:HEAT repeat protein
VIPALCKALNRKDSLDRTIAASTLGDLGASARGAVPALIKALDDNDRDVRTSAVRALGKIGPSARDAVPALIVTLKNSPSSMVTAKRSPVELVRPPASTKGPLDKEKGDERSDRQATLRSEVAAALGQIGPDASAAVPAMLQALKGEPGFVQERIVIALGQIGPDARDAIPTLQALRRDHRDAFVRKAAANALMKIEVK